METREMTPEIRRKLAGFIHFEDGEGIPVTPPGFEDTPEAERPRYFIRPYSKEGLKTRRAWGRNALAARAAAEGGEASTEEVKTYAETVVGIFIGGDGLVRWEGVKSASGKDVPYSRAAVEKLLTVEKLLAWLDIQILELTNGPTAEEREALG